MPSAVILPRTCSIRDGGLQRSVARRTAEILDARGMRGADPSGMHAPFAKP